MWIVKHLPNLILIHGLLFLLYKKYDKQRGKTMPFQIKNGKEVLAIIIEHDFEKE